MFSVVLEGVGFGWVVRVMCLFFSLMKMIIFSILYKIFLNNSVFWGKIRGREGISELD